MKGLLLGLAVALAWSSGAFAVDQCNVNGKRGPQWVAAFEQCTAAQNCHLDTVAACPNPVTERQAYDECSKVVTETFTMCMMNCNNRTNVKFNCS
jgi:hypothetical protein